MFKKFIIFAVTGVVLLGGTPNAAHAVMEDYPSVKLQGLDKSVGRTVTFEAKVGSTIQYGPLYVKIHACRKAPPIEQPESAAFLQIWEVPPGEEKSEWVFSGWMFASSPALSAMDHPVYDVWVLDCTGREEPNEAAQAAQSDEEADQSTLADDEQPKMEDKQDASDMAPVDSEAEDQSPDPQPPGDASPEIQPPASVVPDAPVAEDPVPPTATDEEAEGFTAYDLMKQNGGVSPSVAGETGGNEPNSSPVMPEAPIY